MAKAKKFKIRITQSIFFGLSLILLFLFVNPPLPQLKEAAQYQLLFLGAAGTIFILFLQKELKEFEIKDANDLFGDFAIGTIAGVGTFFAANFIVAAGEGIVNLFGVISYPTLAAATTADLLFIVEIIPLVETIILVGGTMVLANVLRVPYPKVIAAIMIMVFFAAFHFSAAGRWNYEYSFSGFVNFIGNTQISGQRLCSVVVKENCVSTAFPQFILGGLWIALAIGFGSWVTAWRAHSTVNLIGTILLLGSQPTLIALALLQAGIVLVVWKKTKLKEFGTFNSKRFFE